MDSRKEKRKKALAADLRPEIVQISPTRYLELPPGYGAVGKKIRARGVWYGAIRGINQKFEIIYYTGAVRNAIRESDENILFQRFRTTTYGTTRYALKKKNGKMRLLAENNGVNFETEIDSESEIDKILQIIKIVRDGSCQPCKSADNKEPVRRPTLTRKTTQLFSPSRPLAFSLTLHPGSAPQWRYQSSGSPKK